MYWSRIARLSLERPTYLQWCNDVKTTAKERSHLCHNRFCENPFHSVMELNHENISRKSCSLQHKKSCGTGKTHKEAVVEAHAACLHTPKCWPAATLPDTNATAVMAKQLALAMKRGCFCRLRGLDLPVKMGPSHVPRWCKIDRYAIFTKNGRVDFHIRIRDKMKGYMEEVMRSCEWFDAKHQHHTQAHLHLSKDKAVQAGNIVGNSGQWWSSLHETSDIDKWNYGEGSTTRRVGLQYSSSSVNLANVTPVELWAG